MDRLGGIRIARERRPGIAWRWASGDALDDVLGDTQLSAGDFVRWVKQVIDLAGQVADAAAGSPVRDVAREAVRAMRRGVVAYSTVD